MQKPHNLVKLGYCDISADHFGPLSNCKIVSKLQQNQMNFFVVVLALHWYSAETKLNIFFLRNILKRKSIGKFFCSLQFEFSTYNNALLELVVGSRNLVLIDHIRIFSLSFYL